MDDCTALHTAARHYCVERHARWARRYAERAIGVQHPEAQDIYPRYTVLNAILVDIESIVPGDFDTTETLRSILVIAGQTAHDLFTRPPHSAIAARAMTEERELFCTYVRDLSSAALQDVVPLPYRRSLGREEHIRLWARLHERWGPREGDYWHPLLTADLPPHLLAVQQAWFQHAIPSALLQQILRRHGVGHVWELREFGPEYELDLDTLDPTYNGAEGYWTSDDMAWLLYASHESSITVAGEWLIAAVKEAWPNWEQHIYTDWSYDPPPGAAHNRS